MDCRLDQHISSCLSTLRLLYFLIESIKSYVILSIQVAYPLLAQGPHQIVDNGMVCLIHLKQTIEILRYSVVMIALRNDRYPDVYQVRKDHLSRRTFVLLSYGYDLYKS